MAGDDPPPLSSSHLDQRRVLVAPHAQFEQVQRPFPASALSMLGSLSSYIMHEFSLTFFLKKEKVFENRTGRRQVMSINFSKTKSVFGTLAGAGQLNDRHLQYRKRWVSFRAQPHHKPGLCTNVERGPVFMGEVTYGTVTITALLWF